MRQLKKKINSKVSEIHTMSVCLQNVITITYILVGIHVNIYWCAPTHVTCLPEGLCMVPSTCIWIYVSVKSFFLSVHTIPRLVFQRIFSASVMAGIGVYLGRHIYVCPCLCGPVRDSEYKPIGLTRPISW